MTGLLLPARPPLAAPPALLMPAPAVLRPQEALPLNRMPLITPAGAAMPGGARRRRHGDSAKVMRVELQAASGGTGVGSWVGASGAGAVVVVEIPVNPGHLWTLAVPQGGAGTATVAGSGQGGGSARLWRGDSTELDDLVAIAGGGAGGGDTQASGAGGASPGTGAGDDAGAGGPGSDLQGGAGTGGDLSAGASGKGWPDGGDGAGQTGVVSGGGGGGGGLPGGNGGGPASHGSGGQGGTSWADPTVCSAITYLDGSGTAPHAGRNALFAGYGAGSGSSATDGQDGRILVYVDGQLALILDYTGAAVPFEVPT